MIKFFLALLVIFVLTIVSAEEKVLTNLEQAQEIAKKENKDILIDFTGSDWCGWCIRLKQEVFETAHWKENGPKSFVFVELDFPQEKKIDEKQKQYNQTMAQKFAVQGFPTIFLLDAEGNAYAKVGYLEGGAEKYLAHLKEFAVRKAEIVASLKKIAESKDEDALKVIDQIFQTLIKWEVAAPYTTLAQKGIEIKQKLIAEDPENKKGFQSKYAVDLAKYFWFAENKEQTAKYLAMVEKYLPAEAINLKIEFENMPKIMTLLREGKWDESTKELNNMLALKPTGETLQKIYYFMGVPLFRTGKKKEAVECLQKALEAAPQSSLSQEIKDVIEALKK